MAKSTKKKHWIKSEWSMAIIGALFSLIFTIIYDYFKSNPFLSTIGKFFKFIYHSIIGFLTFDIKVWWILCFFIVLIIAICLINVFQKNDTTIKEELPKFIEYKEDWIKGYDFKWNWYKNNGQWTLGHITVKCPKCQTPMNPNYAQYYRCPRCNHEPENQIMMNDIRSIIIDNSNRMVES